MKQQLVPIQSEQPGNVCDPTEASMLTHSLVTTSCCLSQLSPLIGSGGTQAEEKTGLEFLWDNEGQF